MLEDLFAEIEKSHTFELNDDPSTVDRFEKTHGSKLPEDLKEFYFRYKTVRLYTNEGGWRYRFVSISEMQITGLDIYGKYYENDGPDSWFTVCDVMDGNYIAVDLMSKTENQYNYIDCFHETYGIPGECKVIAKSFMELLERCLHSGDTHYYLEKDFQSYGDALEITPETAIRRVEPVKLKWGWLRALIGRRNSSHIQPGWRVKFVQPNNSHLKFFGDGDCGSKEKSFDAAKKYLYENIK